MAHAEGQKPRAFLSSTKLDLENERTIAWLALQQCGFEVVRMEDFQSADHDGWSQCVQTLSSCDVYVLLLGHKYGSILDHAGLSYTEAEYELARDLGIPVFAFVKDGIEAAIASSAQALRLRDFLRAISAAHLIRHPYFRNGDELATSILAALDGAPPSNGKPSRSVRPRFSRTRDGIHDPLAYALARVRRGTLAKAPYRVFLVDTVVALERVLPRHSPSRLLRKAIEIRDELLEMGVDVEFVNELNVWSQTPEEAFIKRSEFVARRASMTICLVHATYDYYKTSAFSGSVGVVAIVHPRHMQLPATARHDAIYIDYDDEDITSCAVAKLTMNCVRDYVDEHLIEVF
jgi:hypothetical protein